MMQAAGVLGSGGVDHKRATAFAPQHRLIMKTRARRRHVQIRLAAAAQGGGMIELAAECVESGPPDHLGRTTWQPLAELPRASLTVSADSAADSAAAGRWCEAVLKLCAEALMEADFAPTVPAASPVTAPAVDCVTVLT